MTRTHSAGALSGAFCAIALALVLVIGAAIPVQRVAASADDTTPTPTAPVNQFDIPADGGLIGLTAVVDGNGDGAQLRAKPDASSTVLASLSDGTVVDLRVDVADTVTDAGGTRWWPVAVNGQDGWISGAFLVSPEQAEASTAAAPDSTTATSRRTAARAPFEYTGSNEAEVSADGDGLVLRAEPDATSKDLGSVPEGTIVTLRIDQVDTVYDSAGTRWWPVTYNGIDGWLSGDYLIAPGTTPAAPAAQTATAAATKPAQTPAPTTAPSGFAVDDFAEIRTPDGNGVNLRAAANAESDTTGFAPNQGLVEILAVADNGWYQVRWDDQTGYIDGDLLIPASAPERAPANANRTSATTTPTPASNARSASTSASGQFAVNDQVTIDAGSDAGVNVRENPGTETNRVGFLAEGAQVKIVQGPEQDADDADWYRVSDGTTTGWVRADLLTEGSATSTSNAPAAQSASANTSSSGFILPVDTFTFTQDFGCSSLGFYPYDPGLGCSVHDGVDLAAPAGTPIHAVADGTVVASGWCDCGLGYYVEIDHGGGLHTVYGHMVEQPPVVVGQAVKQGDTIGSVGSTGLSTGPHVHVMVRQDGTSEDPKAYLPPLS